MYRFRHDRSFERQRVLAVLPLSNEKGLTCKEISEKTGIDPKVVSICLKTLRKQGEAQLHSRSGRWRRTKPTINKTLSLIKHSLKSERRLLH